MKDNKISTKDRLLDSAYKEIYKYGFQGCSVDRILKTPIVLDHVMHNSQHNIEQMRSDPTAKEAIEMTFNNFVNCWNEDIANEIQLIENAI